MVVLVSIEVKNVDLSLDQYQMVATSSTLGDLAKRTSLICMVSSIPNPYPSTPFILDLYVPLYGSSRVPSSPALAS